MWLAIETSVDPGSVAVGAAGGLTAELVTGMRGSDTEPLVPVLEQLLGRAKIPVKALTGVVVGAGPGSYTGLRIAAAAAKGLVHALGIRLLAYPSPAVVAAGFPVGTRPVCVLTSLRTGEAAVTCYSREAGGPRRLLGPEAMRLEDVVSRTASQDPLYAATPGSESRAHLEAAGVRLAPGHLSLPRASALLWLVGQTDAMGEVESWQEWEPDYLGGWGPRP
jgi:tRNA threonylcarbamoyladenosine biosynthesis protein TsaB